MLQQVIVAAIGVAVAIYVVYRIMRIIPVSYTHLTLPTN